MKTGFSRTLKFSGFRIAAWVATILIFVLFILTARGLIDSSLAQLGAGIFGGLIAAYFGAVAAISHQAERERKKAEIDEVNSINQAIFFLGVRKGWLSTVWKDMDELKGDHSRHLMLAPSILVEPTDSFQLRDVQSLLADKRANVVLKLAVEDLQFRSIVSTLKYRDSAHENLQALLGRAGMTPDDLLTENVLKKIGAWDLCIRIKDATDAMYEMVPVAIDEHKKLIDEVRAAAINQYPGRGFIKFNYS